VRLFVAAWPPVEVRDALAALPRPEVPEVRWTLPDRWHVTVAFLGEVTQVELAGWAGVVDDTAAALDRSPEATLGPATELLGPAVLTVPVAGLEIAAAAFRATALGAGRALDERPYRGHLTLARARRRARLSRSLAGQAVQATWTVSELCLVESVPGARGEQPRYVTLSSAVIS